MSTDMRNIDPNLSPTLPYLLQESAGQSEGPAKRDRSLEASPEPPQAAAKTPKKKRFKARTSDHDDLDFACPFFKHDPNKYGGKGGCACYVSKHMKDTMLRVRFYRVFFYKNFMLTDYVFCSITSLQRIEISINKPMISTMQFLTTSQISRLKTQSSASSKRLKSSGEQ